MTLKEAKLILQVANLEAVDYAYTIISKDGERYTIICYDCETGAMLSSYKDLPVSLDFIYEYTRIVRLYRTWESYYEGWHDELSLHEERIMLQNDLKKLETFRKRGELLETRIVQEQIARKRLKNNINLEYGVTAQLAQPK